MTLLCGQDYCTPLKDHPARATTPTAPQLRATIQNLPPPASMHAALVGPLALPLRAVPPKGLLISTTPTHTSHQRGALPHPWGLTGPDENHRQEFVSALALIPSKDSGPTGYPEQ